MDFDKFLLLTEYIEKHHEHKNGNVQNNLFIISNL